MLAKNSSLPVKKAVVLLSGGLDSVTTLYLAKKNGYRCYCLSFDYGQRHRREIKSAQKIAKLAAVHSRVLKISLPWKGSSLLGGEMKTPKRKNEIPSTYVPARNTIFLSFALSYAEAIGAGAVFIGANAIDFSGYPDCRPEYYRIFRKLIVIATKAGAEGKRIELLAPLINKNKAQIVRLAKALGVPLEYTWSCYRGEAKPCNRCDSCFLRAKGFKEARILDPLLVKG